jgi:hypothetical protein
VYRDATLLAEWVLHHFEAVAAPLARRCCQHAIDLLELLALALAGRDVDGALERADDALLRLRTVLRLAHGRGALRDEQLLHATSLADLVGRQVGGWRRSLGPR